MILELWEPLNLQEVVESSLQFVGHFRLAPLSGLRGDEGAWLVRAWAVRLCWLNDWLNSANPERGDGSSASCSLVSASRNEQSFKICDCLATSNEILPWGADGVGFRFCNMLTVGNTGEDHVVTGAPSPRVNTLGASEVLPHSVFPGLLCLSLKWLFIIHCDKTLSSLKTLRLQGTLMENEFYVFSGETASTFLIWARVFVFLLCVNPCTCDIWGQLQHTSYTLQIAYL